MNLEDRVAALEAETARLREQITDTHTLAAHADHDVAEFRSELRAQTRLISALRETQAEQGQVQAAHYAEHKAAVSELKAGIAQIIGMLEGLGGTR